MFIHLAFLLFIQGPKCIVYAASHIQGGSSLRLSLSGNTVSASVVFSPDNNEN